MVYKHCAAKWLVTGQTAWNLQLVDVRMFADVGGIWPRLVVVVVVLIIIINITNRFHWMWRFQLHAKKNKSSKHLRTVGLQAAHVDVVRIRVWTEFSLSTRT
jgi:hypothetical protein